MITKKLKNWLKVLINSYNKLIRGTKKYPRSILPHKNYIQKIDFDELSKEYKFLLLRRTDKNLLQAYDENGLLRTDALIGELKDVPNLSLNLLGGKYKLKHLKFIPKGIGTEKWSAQKFNEYKLPLQSFELRNESFPIYFYLNDIHKIEIPYKRKKDDPVIKKLFHDLKIKLPAELEVNSEGISFVSHEPVNLNYWHAEFCLLDQKTKQVVKRSKIKSNDNTYWQNKLATIALNDILIVNAKSQLNKNDFCEIPKNLYQL